MSVGLQNPLSHCGLADQLTQLENEDELFTALVRQIGPQTSADWVVVYLVDERGRSITLNSRYAWRRSATSHEHTGPGTLVVRDVSWKGGIVGRSARTKEGSLLNSHAEFDDKAKDLLFDFGPAQSAAVLPLIAYGRTVGVLAAGCRSACLPSGDLVLLDLYSTAASAHWARQAASRESGTSSKTIQKLIGGITDAAANIQTFRQTYGQANFLPALARVALALIRAQGCLILTYNPLTNGFFEEECYFWKEGTNHPVKDDDDIFVELVRWLRRKRSAFVESNISDPRVGALWKISQLHPYLSCLATPVTVDPVRESYLLLFSMSRDAFGKLERSIFDLVRQILEVLAAANKTTIDLAYLQRTAAMAHQIAGTTHELRNSATYAARFLYKLRRDLGRLAARPASESGLYLPEMVARAEKAKKEIDRVIHRVEILRQFRKKGQIRLSVRRINLNDLVEEVCHSTQTFADEKGIVIKSDFDASLPEIESDPVLLHECLSNLLLNAIYFTKAKGQIDVGTRYFAMDPLPVHAWVSDEGGGIHGSELHQIFEPFYSTKQLRRATETEGNGDPDGAATDDEESRTDQSGTGLGLFLTKNNMTLLGGMVEVDSIMTKSSKFTLQLPLRFHGRQSHA